MANQVAPQVMKPLPRQPSRARECTHTTMTRLYTSSFRCSLCLKHGSMGWLYRCTQDRELLLDEDLLQENKVSISYYLANVRIDESVQGYTQGLRHILEPSTQLPTRGPAARSTNCLAFLDEVTGTELMQYSPGQVAKILAQKFQADRVIKDSMRERLLSPRSKFSPIAMTPEIAVQKPWLPHHECQFKCCAACRPSMMDRAFLSINSILAGDIPATALTGFGFHLEHKRPVADVKHVKNLGLRPCPPCFLTPRTPPPTTLTPPTHTAVRHLGLLLVGNDGVAQSSTDSENVGLGLIQSTNGYDSANMLHSHNSESDVVHSLMIRYPHISDDIPPYYFGIESASDATPPTISEDNAIHTGISTDINSTPLGVCHQPDHDIGVNPDAGRIIIESDTHSSLGSLRENVAAELRRPLRPRSNLGQFYEEGDLEVMSLDQEIRQARAFAGLLGLATGDSSRAPVPEGNRTPMEMIEAREGHFGRAQSEMPDDVAVTEAAVELYVTDIMTRV